MFKQLKKIFITGGAGYVGASLVSKLLSYGYKVTVYDLLIFGADVLKPHKNLSVVNNGITINGKMKTIYNR